MWHHLDATDSMTAQRLAHEVEVASERLHTATFVLTEPPLTPERTDAIVAALAPLPGTYQFRARVRAPLDAQRIRALHRAGFVELELPASTPWSATLATVRRCDALGVAVRYPAPLVELPEAAALARTIPALVHLTPPEPPDDAPELLVRALAHWRAVHGRGLLTWRRSPEALRIADSRRMAWCGHSSGARPRVVTLRDDDVIVHDLCEQPRTIDELVESSPLPRERLESLLLTLMDLQLLLPVTCEPGQPPHLLAMASSAPAWWERDAVDARLPPEGQIPAESTIWRTLLDELPWTHEPTPPRHVQLPLAPDTP